MSLLTSVISQSTSTPAAANTPVAPSLVLVDQGNVINVSMSVKAQAMTPEEVIGQTPASLASRLSMDPSTIGTYVMHFEDGSSQELAPDYVFGDSLEGVTRISGAPASSATLG